MASQRQLEANRANAKRSTGPKSQHGKARSLFRNKYTAATLLDWRPTTPLKEGLAKTIAYFDRLLTEGEIPRAPEMAGAEELASGF